MPPRLVGLYALTCMERDGVVYGYSLAGRIAERTGGAWRPGPGAVYPALQHLTERGLATVSGAGRRREYRITIRGRGLLRKLRQERLHGMGSAPDLSILWAEIVGAPDESTYLLHRLRRVLDGVETQLERQPDAQVGDRSLRESVLGELRSAEGRLGRGHRTAHAPGRRSGRRP